MKYFLFYLLSLISILPSWGQNRMAYDPYTIRKNNIIKINILSGFVGTINLSYETKLINKWSIQGAIAYTNLLLDASTRKRTSVEGIQTGIDIRHYNRDKQKWNGWYSQFMMRYNSYDYHYYVQDSTTNNAVVNYQEKLKGISLGYIFGYQRTYRNRFVIDAFTGIYFSVPISYESTPLKKPINFTGQSFENNPYTNGESIDLA